MKYIFILISLLTLASCTPDTPLSKQFYEANKVKLLMYSGDAVGIHFETNDVEKIKDWLKYINEKDSTTLNSCNYEGRLVLYFTETDTNEMHFSIKSDCRQITYNIDG